MENIIKLINMKKIFFLCFFAVMFLFVGCKKDDDPTNTTPADCVTQLETPVKCKATLPDCDGEQLKVSVQCLGKTTSNARCKNNTKNPCGYCYLHTDQWDGNCPNMTNNACGYCEEHTDQYSGK
jgi:hypothetical protein